jgi:hypothetical protein
MAELLRALNARRLLLAGANVAAGVTLAYLLAGTRGDGPVTPAPPRKAHQWFAPMAAQAPVAAPAAASMDENGLRRMLDEYLVGQAKTGGPGRLKEALDRRFSGPALERATRIAASYQRYIDAHDALLAAQSFDDANVPDVARLRVWVQQRARLRESMLGSALAEAWYGDEAVGVEQVLDELEQRGTAAPSGSVDDPRAAVSEQVKRREALRHEADVRAVLRGLTRSFASMAG